MGRWFVLIKEHYLGQHLCLVFCQCGFQLIEEIIIQNDYFTVMFFKITAPSLTFLRNLSDFPRTLSLQMCFQYVRIKVITYIRKWKYLLNQCTIVWRTKCTNCEYKRAHKNLKFLYAIHYVKPKGQRDGIF